MRLYPDAVSAYIHGSGRIRTKTSETTFRKVIQLLHEQHPDQHAADYTTDQLTTFCLQRFAGEGPLAGSTVKQRRAHIRSLFSWLTFKQYIERNPAEDLTWTVRPARNKVRPGTWLPETTVADILDMFDTSTQKGRRDRTMFLFGISTGLRPFELVGLRWPMFTPDLTRVRVTRKGGKKVDRALPPDVTAAMREWRKERWTGGEAVWPTFRSVWLDNERQTVANWDQPIGVDAWRFVLRDISERTNLKIRPHDLRRSIAGILEERGTALKDIQDFLDHNNLATTDRYLSTSPARRDHVTSGVSFRRER